MPIYVSSREPQPSQFVINLLLLNNITKERLYQSLVKRQAKSKKYGK